MNVLLDEKTAPALRTRKEPPLLLIHTRQLEYLPEQIPFIRFLEGQESPTGLLPAFEHLDLDLLGGLVTGLGRGTHRAPV